MNMGKVIRWIRKMLPTGNKAMISILKAQGFTVLDKDNQEL